MAQCPSRRAAPVVWLYYPGTSVAIDAGGTIFTGAPGDESSAPGLDGNEADNLAPRSGAVFVFH